MPSILPFFFFNDTATTEIYTLSLHDALPILRGESAEAQSRERMDNGVEPAHAHSFEHQDAAERHDRVNQPQAFGRDRKSTRLNSSHANISYAVFCLKKKKKKKITTDNCIKKT